jgi:hypothetical protein
MVTGASSIRGKFRDDDLRVLNVRGYSNPARTLTVNHKRRSAPREPMLI